MLLLRVLLFVNKNQCSPYIHVVVNEPCLSFLLQLMTDYGSCSDVGDLFNAVRKFLEHSR